MNLEKNEKFDNFLKVVDSNYEFRFVKVSFFKIDYLLAKILNISTKILIFKRGKIIFQ